MKRSIIMKTIYLMALLLYLKLLLLNRIFMRKSKECRAAEKLIVKRIPVSVNYSKMIEEGRITVENCSNCWKTTDDDKQIDVMVSHILFQLFLRYQEEGKIPDSINILF